MNTLVGSAYYHRVERSRLNSVVNDVNRVRRKRYGDHQSSLMYSIFLYQCDEFGKIFLLEVVRDSRDMDFMATFSGKAML